MSPASIAANGTSTAKLTVHIKDAAGDAVSGDAGQIGLQTGTNGPSFGTVSQTAPASTPRTVTSSPTPGKFTLTATDNGVSGTTPLTQLGRRRVSRWPRARRRFAANGTSTAKLTIRVKDAAGDAVSGDAGQIMLQTDPGGPSFGPVSQSAPGFYTATLTSSTTPGTFTMTAADNSVTPPVSGSTKLKQTSPPSSALR